MDPSEIMSRQLRRRSKLIRAPCLRSLLLHEHCARPLLVGTLHAPFCSAVFTTKTPIAAHANEVDGVESVARFLLLPSPTQLMLCYQPLPAELVATLDAEARAQHNSSASKGRGTPRSCGAHGRCKGPLFQRLSQLVCLHFPAAQLMLSAIAGADRPRMPENERQHQWYHIPRTYLEMIFVLL